MFKERSENTTMWLAKVIINEAKQAPVHPFSAQYGSRPGDLGSAAAVLPNGFD